MDYAMIILAAAKKVGVSGHLLLAICQHESGLKNLVHEQDGGSSTFGVCQIKQATAELMGYKGNEAGLMKPEINAYYAAKYLKYQHNRYEGNLCKAIAAYNSGTYYESKVVPGKPKNLVYVRNVQNKLDEELQDMLSCDNEI